MHDTALDIGGRFFSLYYPDRNPHILDLGSANFNGSLREVAPTGSTYVGADIAAGPGVDIVLGDRLDLPFETGTFDAVVSSSVFEHAEMFWVNFLEMVRVTKQGGYIYINAPSNGYYHAYPHDNWRFYPDAGIALESWAGKSRRPVQLIESFTARRKTDCWNDFVAVFCKGRKGQFAFPTRLLVDEFSDAFNIRTFRSKEVVNPEARSEDMLLKDAAIEDLAAARETELELLRTIASQEAARQGWQRNLDELQERHAAALQEVEQHRDLADATVNALRSEIAVRHEEIKQQLSFREELSEQLNVAIAETGRLAGEVQVSHRTNEQLSEQLNAVLVASESLTNEVDALQAELSSVRAEYHQQSVEIDRASVELHSLRSEIADLCARLEEAATNAFSLSRKNLDLNAVIVEQVNEIEDLRSSFANAEREVLRLNSEISDYKRDAERASADRANLDRQLVEFEGRNGHLARESAVFARQLKYHLNVDVPLEAGGKMLLSYQGSRIRKRARAYVRGIGSRYFGRPTDLERRLRHLVDQDFYYSRYPDVHARNHPALRHFIDYGWREGRNPNALFNVTWYLQQNPDVARAGDNPLDHYVRFGWIEGRNPGPDFNVDHYLRTYDDVRTSGVEPLTHYLQHGIREGRQPKPASKRSDVQQQIAQLTHPEQRSSAPRFKDHGEPLRVVLISSDSASPSHIYRVENMARGLGELGCEVEIVPLHELWRIIDRIDQFHAAIFWRIAIGPRFGWSGDIESLLRDCRKAGVATFFDVDDLVFDPAVCTPQFVDGLRYLDAGARELYDAGVRGYRDLLRACGQATVTTTSLRQAAERFQVRTFVVPNGLDSNYEEALEWPLIQHERDKVIIGYTPGTKTHQKDFADAAEAVARVLAECPMAQLWILGPLDISEFPSLAKLLDKQVFVNPAVGRDKVFKFNQRIDVTIIPLEQHNPFTAAKSELKYFEAGVFGVPAIASAVGPYQECIVDGENGFVAAAADEWFDKLRQLVADRDRRHRMGRKAREQVEARYRAKPIAATLLDAIQRVREDMRVKDGGGTGWTPEEIEEYWPARSDYLGDRPLTINWIINGLIVGGGGHRMLLRAAHHLSRFGHRVRLYFTDTDLSVGELRELLHRHFFPIDCPIYIYRGTMKPADVVFATYWKTVDIALRHRDVCTNLFYFVQDYEPYFFAMGSDYIQAENTYRQGLYSITAGPWCAHFIRKQFDGEADHFVFPIEGVYQPGRRMKSNPNLVFFAKPEMPRRCYEIGVEVLREVHMLRPDVEIIMFGSRDVHADRLPFPATCRNVLSVNELAQMYRDADVGLAFSPTNPSAVPYEMMACGLPVVDMARPHAEENYGGRFDLAKLASPVPARMAEEIVALLDDPRERHERSQAGLEFVKNNPTEEEMGRRIEHLVVSRVAKMAKGSILEQSTKVVASLA